MLLWKSCNFCTFLWLRITQLGIGIYVYLYAKRLSGFCFISIFGLGSDSITDFIFCRGSDWIGFSGKLNFESLHCLVYINWLVNYYYYFFNMLLSSYKFLPHKSLVKCSVFQFVMLMCLFKYWLVLSIWTSFCFIRMPYFHFDLLCPVQS